MGLCIHYKGALKVEESLALLIDEIKDISDVHQWKYHIFERELKENSFASQEFDDSIYGICFAPPECEPVCFTFLSNGIICTPWALSYYLDTKDDVLMNSASVKTQYAGPSTHRMLVHLFDYISITYLKDFEVEDETGYWTERNEKKLNDNFERMNSLLEQVAGIIKTVKIKEGENFEVCIQELIRKLKDAKYNE